jgi:hypothetical protein
MSYNLTLERGTSAFSTTAKLGADSLSGGVYGTTAISALMASGNSQPISAFTWDAWVQAPTSDTAGVQVAVGESGAPNVGTGCWLGINAGKAGASVGSVNPVSLTSTTVIDDGSWHLMSLVWTGGANGTARLYVDGVQIATGNGSGTTAGATNFSTSYFSIGGFAGQGSTYDLAAKSVLVDEVSISNVAQYSGSSFTVPSAAFSSTRTGQVALYHLDGDATDSNVPPSVTIPANDANIVYSPFTWDVQSARAKTINAGAYLRAVINGSISTLTATFDTTNVTYAPVLLYRVDDGPWTIATLAPSVALTIPTTNVWTSHYVEIVVGASDFNSNRWTTDAAAVKFLGFVCGGGTSPATRATQRRGLNLLALGDSITEGLYTLKFTSASGPPTDLTQSNARQGWAYGLADNLGAEIGIVGFGGTGLSVGYGDVPALPTAYSVLFNAATAPARSFTSPVPDAIIINEGSNDSDSAAAFQALYTTLLNNLLAATPSTTVIVAMRPFNGSYASSISAASVACNAPSRVYYCDTTGWHSTSDGSSAGGAGLHPYGYEDTQNLTQRTAAAVRAAFAQRGPLFVGLGGGAVKTLSPYRG